MHFALFICVCIFVSKNANDFDFVLFSSKKKNYFSCAAFSFCLKKCLAFTTCDFIFHFLFYLRCKKLQFDLFSGLHHFDDRKILSATCRRFFQFCLRRMYDKPPTLYCQIPTNNIFTTFKEETRKFSPRRGTAKFAIVRKWFGIVLLQCKVFTSRNCK